MMKQKSKTSRLKNQLGVSLVEILIVVVILLFGILSIIKVFPSGFLVMRNSANVGRADRLDTALLDQANANGSTPDSVFAVPPTTGLFDPSVIPTDLTSTGATVLPNSDDINKARFIYNEKVSIPTSTMPGGFFPSVVLNYGPIYLPLSNANNILTGGLNALTKINPTYMNVVSMPWTERDTVGTGADAPNDGEFDVDKSTASDTLTPPGNLVYSLRFPRRLYDQVFYITFTQPNGTPQRDVLHLPAWDGKVVLGTSTPLDLDSATNYNGDMVQVISSPAIPENDMNNYGYFLSPPPPTWSSIQVSRVFVPATDGVFSSQPYEYTLPNLNKFPLTQLPVTQGGATVGDVNYGVLWFNPLIAQALSGQNAKALVSYTVYDWHILHEDHIVTPGAGASTTVDLSVDGLKTPGDVQADNSIYNAVVAGTYPQPDGLYVLDLDTGEPVTNVDDQFYDPSTGATGGTVAVDYRAGKVTLGSGTLAAHPHLRFYYRTSDDMAVALEKTPDSFTAGADLNSVVAMRSPSALGGSNPPTITPFNAYFVPPNYNSTNSVDRILFPPCMAGQSVVLQNITYTGKNASGLPVNVSLGSQSIQATVSQTTGAITEGGETATVAYADITSQLENAVAAGITRNPGDPFTVSFATAQNTQGFCIWHENGKWKTHTVSVSGN